MRNSSKKLLAFLLVFIMLFAVSATVISAASKQDNGTDAQADSTAVTEGSFSLEWFEIEYVDDEIVVTVKPQYAEQILSLSKADIEQLMKFALEMSKDVVLDDFIDAIVGTEEHATTVEFGRAVMENALGIYMKNNYGAKNNDKFIEFFEDVMASDKEVIELSDFICTLVNTAVVTRSVYISNLPTPEEFDGEMEKMLDENKKNIISVYFDEQFDLYKAYKSDKTGTAEAPVLVDLIDHYGRSYVKNYLINNKGLSEVEAEFAIDNYTLTADDYIDFFASAGFDQGSIKFLINNDSEALDDAMLSTIGYTLAEVDARIDEVEAMMYDEYVAVYEKVSASKTPTAADLVDMLDLVDYIDVNYYVIFGNSDDKGKVFIVNTVKQLIKDLPTFEEIANMSDEEMQLSYFFRVFSPIGKSQFRVTFKLGGGHDEVRKIAQIVANNVSVNYLGNNEVDIDINVPDELAKAALKACNSSRVPDELKQKVFAAMSKTPGDAYAFIKDVTVDDLLKIFDYVDFEDVLDSKYLERFEQLDGLTEEQIKNKIKQYENYYNKAMKVIKKVYGYLPESVTEKTIFDFYCGNGSFNAAADTTVDVATAAGKFSDKLADLIDGFADNTVISFAINVDVKFQDVYRVTYHTGNEVVRDGFLPVGADIEFFAGQTSYNGSEIIAWVDANGTEYTEMPEADVKLYAITATAEAILSASANSKVYDGNAIELVAEATPFHPSATYSYTWYKNGEIIDGATASAIAVTNVKDSGEYYCVITVVDYGVETVLTTNTETITIAKKGITLADAIEWTNAGPFTYNGEAHGVSVAIKSEYAALISLVSITGNEAADAKDYTAVAKFESVDDNYAIEGEDEASMPWTINPKTFTDSDIVWVGGAFEYNYGTEHSVSATYPVELEVVLSGNKATNAGSYVAKAVVSIAGGNTNYAWAGSDVIEYTWAVAPKAIDLSTFGWVAYNSKDNNHDSANFAFIYNGGVQGVKITNLPEDIALALVLSNASATNATTVNLIATAEIDDTAYRALTGASVYANYSVAKNSTGAYKAFTEKEWGIAKAVITVSNVSWINYSGIVYDAENHAPTLNITESELAFNYVYEVRLSDGSYEELDAGQLPKKAGFYRAIVTITPADPLNYKVVLAGVEKEIEFSIAKRVIALDGVKWNYTDAFTYNGSDHVVALDTTYIAANLKYVNIAGATDAKKNAGTYTSTATISLIDADSCEFTVAGAPTVNPAVYDLTWQIKKAQVALDGAKWDYTDAFTYTGEDFTVSFTTGLATEQIALVNVANATDSKKNAGSYDVTAIVSLKDADNYEFTVAGAVVEGAQSYPLTWQIKKAQVALDGAKWDYTDAFTYTGEDFTVSFTTGLAAEQLALVNVAGATDSKKNAGNYDVTAIVSLKDADNYEFTVAGEVVEGAQSCPLSWQIKKAQVALDGAKWDYTDAFTYTGEDFTVSFTTGLAAEQLALVNVAGATDSKKNAGSYDVTAIVSLKDADNYEFTVAGAVVDGAQSYPLSWQIKKAQVALDGAKWDYTDAFTYTGEDFTVSFTTGLTAEQLALVNVANATDSKKNAGNYDVTAIVSLKDADNYEFTKVGAVVEGAQSYALTWEIQKANVVLGDFTWDYANNLFYNGNAHTVTLNYSLTAEQLALVTVSGTTDSYINAGSYISVATFTLVDPDNYVLVSGGNKIENYVDYTLNWEIKKATTYGVTFSDAAFEFDAQGHSIFVEGTLPEGVEVTYTGNPAYGLGTHLVVATIPESDNYEQEILTAYITINLRSTDTIVNQFQNGYLVIVTLNGEGIASGYELNSSIVDDVYADLDLSAIAREGFTVKLARAYDINFSYGGHAATADGNFTVRIAIPMASTGAENDNLAIVYIAEDGTIQTLEGIRSGNYMMFETTHFSVYGIVEYTEIVEEDGSEEPTVCPGHEDNDNDGNCDYCGEDVSVPEYVCPGHEDNDCDRECDYCGAAVAHNPVDVDNDGKCDKCGNEINPVIDGGDEEVTEKADNTWVWILIAIIIAVIIALLIFVVMKKNDEDEGDDEASTKPAIDGGSAPAAPAPVEEAPVEEAPVEEAPVEEAPVEEAPVEEAPVEEAPVEEAPVEEAPVEEAPVEEAPVEEAPVEEAPVEEAPAEPAAPSYAQIFAASENADAVRLVNGVVVPVRYRTSFMSRLIQSEEPIQTYYTIVKNYLLAFKGVKARTSWNFESFNKGRIQCAKLNVKGSAFQVYLGLDTNEYSEDKYHFVYAGDKPKLDKVPMMMKVKSERSLKYTLELIDEVMAKNGIEKAEVPEVDYHMPYESTEALVDKDLVKVILPDGMEIDENTIIEKVNVGALLDEVRPEEAPVEEAPVEEAPVEEAPVEEAPVEEAPVEEAPVEEAPVEAAPVEEAPAEEAPVEEAPVEEAPVEVAPVEEAPVEEAPVEEAPVEEAPVEEAPVEEAPVEEAPVEEAPVEEAPVEEAPVEEAPAEIHIVDHQIAEEDIVQVDAVKADEIISDEQAEELIETVARVSNEKPKSNKCHEVNLDVICDNFEDGETVNLETLKEKALISKKAERVKILARGVMTKRLTVVADKFSIQAVKMIGLAGGLAQKYEN